MNKLSEIFPNPTLIPLMKGNHATRDAGVCLMEAVAWWAGEPHSDSPRCVDGWLADLGRKLNDNMLDHYRQGFADLVPVLAGTATDGKSKLRNEAHWSFVEEVLRPLFDAAPKINTDTEQHHSLFAPVRVCAREAGWEGNSLLATFGYATDETYLEAQELIAQHFARLVHADSLIMGGEPQVPAEPVQTSQEPSQGLVEGKLDAVVAPAESGKSLISVS